MDWKQLSDDFRQKYEHCHAHVTLEGHTEPELYWLSEVEYAQRGAPLLHFINDDKGEIILKYDDSASDINWSFPSMGLFSHNNQVFIAQKKYDRQWKGGMTSSNLGLYNLYHRISPAYGGNLIDNSLIVSAFKSRPLVSMGEGIKQLKTKAAMALSSEFAIGLPITDDDKILLFYYANPIATVNESSKYILLKETQFKQEFQDFTRTIAGVDAYDIRS